MVAITFHHAVETTAQTSTSTTYENKGQTITLDAGTSTYIIFCSAQIWSDNGDALSVNARVLIDGTEAAGSEVVAEPRQSDPSETYFYMQKHTTSAGDTEVVQFQMKTTSPDTMTADSIVLFAMKLDDLKASDWAFTEDDDTGGLTAHTTTLADFASITFTPQKVNDDWLIIGNGSVDCNDVATSFEELINFDSGTEVVPRLLHEPEDPDELLSWVLQRVFTLSAASHTFKIQSRDDTGPTNDHIRSAIFALRLNAFSQYSFDWNATEFVMGGTVYEEMNDLAFTPRVASQNWVVFAGIVFDVPASGGGSYRVQLGGADIPAGFGDNKAVQRVDVTDLRSCGGVHFLGSLTATVQDLDIDVKVPSTLNDPHDRSFAVFSMELAIQQVLKPPLQTFFNNLVR